MNENLKEKSVVGHLTIINIFTKFRRNRNILYAQCKCVCGKDLDVLLSKLKYNYITSCGCSPKTFNKKIKHGMTGTRIYQIWRSMISRCYRETDDSFSHYGGKGIQVCSEWRNDFQEFYRWSQQNNYSDSLSIDRIDNNKDYYPGNCRYSDIKTQNRNKGNNHLITIFGETKTIVEWSEDDRCVVNYQVFRSRINNKVEPEAALTLQYKSYNRKELKRLFIFGESKTIREWSNDERCEISEEALRCRLDQGWEPERAITTKIRKIRKTK